MKKTFRERALAIVRKIPKGKALTYQEVAARAGNRKAARAVGMIMSKNKDRSIPCHRVIRSDGKIGAYNGLLGKSKRALLLKEGYLLGK